MVEPDKILNLEEEAVKESCPKGIKNIQNLYLGLVGILPFFILTNTLFQWASSSNFFEMLLRYLIILGIYYGISRVKSWVVIFVLLISYWGALQAIMSLLVQYSDIPELVGARISSTLFLCFSIYQIIIFSKKGTNEYFKVKGKVII